jgi:hypothetical protein
MKTYFTVEDYLEFLSSSLKSALQRDFGEQAHIVDLLSHTSSQVEAIFYWMADYPKDNK